MGSMERVHVEAAEGGYQLVRRTTEVISTHETLSEAWAARAATLCTCGHPRHFPGECEACLCDITSNPDKEEA